jgi:hypothetical protein
MAIAKKPLRNPNAIPTGDADKAAEAFISKAGNAPTPKADIGKTPVLFRFKNDFLQRIDAAAKKHELPRLAWVRTVIAEALETEGL